MTLRPLLPSNYNTHNLYRPPNMKPQSLDYDFLNHHHSNTVPLNSVTRLQSLRPQWSHYIPSNLSRTTFILRPSLLIVYDPSKHRLLTTVLWPLFSKYIYSNLHYIFIMVPHTTITCQLWSLRAPSPDYNYFEHRHSSSVPLTTVSRLQSLQLPLPNFGPTDLPCLPIVLGPLSPYYSPFNLNR